MDWTMKVADPDQEDYEPPSPLFPGDVIVEIFHVYEPGAKSTYRYDLGEYSLDTGAAPFWIQEGVGMDYWVDWNAPDYITEGVWVFEDVTCHYTRGDGWTTDDDEEWDFKDCRPATNEEIAELFECSWWDCF